MNGNNNFEPNVEDDVDDRDLPPMAPAKHHFDKAAFDEFTAAGRKAWADVPDVTAWVAEIRGGGPLSPPGNLPVMHPGFLPRMENVIAAFDRLMAAPSASFPLKGAAPAKGGIYVFEEEGKAFYVGRTDNLLTRLGQHQRPSSPTNQASFAARLARENIGSEAATYLAESSRKMLHATEEFALAFIAAKTRVRAMQVRLVELTDPVEQAVLEIYAATILEAPYSDFSNH